MDYRYKKSQIFNKKLPVPKEVLKRVYNNQATIKDFIDYDLTNKIPIECLDYNYRDIAKIVGIDKALFLDWDCIIGAQSYRLIPWFTKNNKSEYSAEELNKLLYTEMRDEYYTILEKRDVWSDKDLLDGVYDSISQRFNFKLLGEKFAKIYPEMLYTTNFEAARHLLTNSLDLPMYLAYYEEYKNIPIDFVQQALHKDSDKKIFKLLAPYITDSNNLKSDELLLKLVFNTEYTFEYEKYIKIIEENPEIDAHTFLEEACLVRIKDQNWLKPNNYYISRYNAGRDKKFTFGEKVDSDILSLIDQMPEYRTILSQLLRGSISINMNNFNNVEELISHLINNYNLYYDTRLPDKFKLAYPELFLDLDENSSYKFYSKGLSLSDIYGNPQWREVLKNKNIFLGFSDKQMSEFIKTIGNERFFELCLKYGNHLVPVKLENETQTYEELIEQKIIEKITGFSSYYYGNLNGIKSIVENIPDYFLDDGSPEELKKLFYDRKLTSKLIQEHPEWVQLLINKELSAGLYGSDYGNTKTLYKMLGKNDFFTICQKYGKYLSDDNFPYLSFDGVMTREDTLADLEGKMYLYLYTRRVPYDDKMPQEFKEKYSYLFLPEDVPNDIKEKFYNRLFEPTDFENNLNMFKYFEKLDIACYLNPDYSWLIGKPKNIEIDNLKKIKILTAFKNINDIQLQQVFKLYVLNTTESIDFDKIDILADLLFRLSYSNSSEMQTFRTELANQLIQSDNPSEKLNKIEDIFLRNNLPVVGKIFSVFQTLHPDFSKFDFSESSKASPILKSESTKGKEIIIFADLLKSAFGSNNHSIRDYLENIEQGYKLFLQISSTNTSFNQLDDKNKQILSTFVAHLNILYNNTLAGKGENNFRKLSGDINSDMNELVRLFSENGSLTYDLPDRIIKMFGHFAGFDTFAEAKEYFMRKPMLADLKNREASNNNMTLEVGDFVKGIRDIKYLKSILQNGSVAKEFLGSSAESDKTPLDTDLSRILEIGNNLSDTLNKTEASGYGTVWLVLKNDDRFTITRKSPNEIDQSIDTNPNLYKIEAFYTGVDGKSHYGIRTGFASSEINYIITENNDSRIGLELAMNGFYIPVINKEGNLIFSPQDYDAIRTKMKGLKHFETGNYCFSDSLSSPETEELSNMIHGNEIEVSRKRECINNTISRAINSMGLRLKNVIDGDLSDGSIELIDTGSTGRGTNMPGDGDFDFMIRLDKKVFSNPEKMKELKTILLKTFGKESTSEITAGGDFRLKNVLNEGLDKPVDIDITFVEKTDKLTYSTEMCLQDRLSTIKEQSPENYALVVANILLAKQVLKKAGVYKPNRGDNAQGGLGGVGIENWILQNGGSFIEAANNFLEASKGKTFEEFKTSYSVWDFGENHFANKKNLYPHDDFIRNNMSEEGYLKMIKILTSYLKYSQQQSNKVTR